MARSTRAASVLRDPSSCNRLAIATLVVILIALCASLAGVFGSPRAAAESSSTSTVADGDELVAGSLVDDEYGIGINGFSRLNKGREVEGYGYSYPVNDPSAFIVVAGSDNIVVFVPAEVAEAVGYRADDEGYTAAFWTMLGELDSQGANGGQKIKKIKAPVTYAIGQDSVVVDGTTYTRDVEIESGTAYVTVVRSDGKANKSNLVCCDFGQLVSTSEVLTQKIPTWYEKLGKFLSEMDYSPLYVSLKTSFASLLIIFILGILAAWKSLKVKQQWQGLVDTIFTIPMVLPPTVCGFLLLLCFGNASGIGQWLIAHGMKLAFTWQATVIAAVVVGFPLMYRTARGAFEALDSNMLDAARTLGWSETRIFVRLMVPLAWPSIAAGTVLAFARAMGEFGATLFFAGNYVGVTQTMPIAIYFEWMGGRTDVAIFWVIVVIFISFLVILIINLYSAHTQRYRKGGLSRAERRQLRKQGSLEGDDINESGFGEIHAEAAQALLGDTMKVAASDAVQPKEAK